MVKSDIDKIINVKLLLLLIIDVTILSYGHFVSNKIIIFIALLFFIFIVISNRNSKFFPIMLFYLPWSPIMKFTPGTLTLYSIIIPIFFLLFFYQNKKISINYNVLIITSIMGVLTLFVKFFHGYTPSSGYFMFIIMLFFLPTYFNTYKGQISFEKSVLYMSIGVIGACISSETLMKYPHMRGFINVSTWDSLGLTRLSGFNGDPNYYSAQILVAIAGLLIILLTKRSIPLLLLTLPQLSALIYFGLQSISKMFLFILIILIGLWGVALIHLLGIVKSKKYLVLLSVVCIIGFFIFLNNSKELIDMYLIRFELSNNVNSLSSGRSNIAIKYLIFFENNLLDLLFGQGYTEKYPAFGKSSHNVIIEIIYQFGVVGSILLIVWIYYLNKSVLLKKKFFSYFTILPTLILIIACFLPWLSLDVVFADEFFYVTCLFLLGKSYLIQCMGKEKK
ncbi:hypothetical protein [Halobacillus sp. Nhm2S1]|uniref:hypothetical protein n=1 Tax=Halobacillus sp. Nhm2S1 TaxID=2866716 RepID=UPI001C72C224|nr:hypothetical protein [Halobacillus sp. Nhm2S1]MBX0357720.1 hypothetical protein [Halobacillus sp. Nhm2S1]